MDTTHRRKRTLRAPLVMTVAATSALAAVGCGASVTPIVCDGGNCGDTPTPRPESCPSSPSAAGTACPTPGQRCGYGTTACPGIPAQELACDARTNTWQPSFNSCNPPACPVAEPTHGSYCTPGWQRECNYGDCYGSPTTRATCDTSTSRWSVQVTECNPPPPVCPSTQPRPNEPCDPNGVPASCNYPAGDCFGTPLYVTSVCDPTSRQWQVYPSTCNPPAPTECPSEPPTPGTFCNLRFDIPQCEYGDCFGQPTTFARCPGGTFRWEVGVRSCNPPAPDGGGEVDASSPDAG